MSIEAVTIAALIAGLTSLIAAVWETLRSYYLKRNQEPKADIVVTDSAGGTKKITIDNVNSADLVEALKRMEDNQLNNCKGCNGTGKCFRCNGSGVSGIDTSCPKCGGSGNCTVCRGTGKS